MFFSGSGGFFSQRFMRVAAASTRGFATFAEKTGSTARGREPVQACAPCVTLLVFMATMRRHDVVALGSRGGHVDVGREVRLIARSRIRASKVVCRQTTSHNA